MTRSQASEPLDLETAPSGTNRQSQPVTDYSAINQEHIHQNIPADRAVADRRQSLTLAGTRRIRIMWTTNMNRAVMEFYYKTTKMETEMTNYRREMLNLFNERFPRFAERMTESKLMERKRYLINNNKFSQAEINEIKHAVESQLEILHAAENTTEESSTHSTNTRRSVLNVSILDVIEEQNGTFNNERDQELCNELAYNLNTAVTLYFGTEPTTRMKIPKLRYSSKLIKIIDLLNDHLLPRLIPECSDLENMQTIIYCAAYATFITLGLKMRNYTPKQTPYKPSWMKRLENRIEKTRVILGRITQFKNGIRTSKLLKKINKDIHPIIIEEITPLELQELLHSKTQRLRILANRLKRYSKRIQRQAQNKEFENNQHKFYQKLQNSNTHSTETNMADKTQFWRNIWENPTSYNKESVWIKEEINRCNILPNMENIIIETNDVKEATKRTQNWKSPGIDNVHNYWYKKLTVFHEKFADLINEILTNPSSIPCFMTQGITYLIPKTPNSTHASNDRPITCLPTIYKIISSIITTKIHQHCVDNNILTDEQKGCSIGTRGCKDQIILDSIIVGQAKNKNRNLSMAYIDYKKAFDSMSHEYLLDILKIYKISQNIINFFKHSIRSWKTKLCINNGLTSLLSSHIQIQRGIFQGDSFSPLWFCLGMNPISNTIKNTSYGFDLKSPRVTHKINHSFFMDDLKLYANSQEQLNKMLSITEKISYDINMEFNTDKTKTVHLYRGQVIHTSGYITQDENIISDIANGNSYKYLGFAQLRGILHTNVKEKMKKLFKKRLNDTLKTLLNSKNKTKAINQYVIPYLSYSFGIIKWSNTDLDDIERIIRKCMRYNHMHDPKSAIERINIPRELGGRAILNIKMMQIKEIESLRHYFRNNSTYEVICAADEGYTPLHLNSRNFTSNITTRTTEELIESWKSKQLHGIFVNQMLDSNINLQLSNKWLTKGELYSETEGFMISIQDRVVPTRNYKKYILHQNVINENCRLCGKVSENIDHITNGCTIMANTEYLERHNNVAKIIHQQLAIKCEFITEHIPYYKYEPIRLLENNEYMLTWDKPIETDKQIDANKPDILYWNKKQKTVYIIDIAIPLNQKVLSTHGEKIRKYTDLLHELKKLWNVQRVSILPIIISSTGLISNTLVESLNKLEMEKELEEMQKTVILGTCRITRKFFSNN